MIRPLDFWIFGNGHGFAAPHFDQPFYWLNGEFYTFNAWLGAQLHSVQWAHPKPGDRRTICGVEFRPFQSRRSWGRVMVSWAAQLPHNLNEANEWLRQFERHLRHPIGGFRYQPAQGIEARSDEPGTGSVHESPTPKGVRP